MSRRTGQPPGRPAAATPRACPTCGGQVATVPARRGLVIDRHHNQATNAACLGSGAPAGRP